MTPFASVALFLRKGEILFRPPRKERPTETTQARKAAYRFWRGNAGKDTLVKVVLLREIDGILEISERGPNGNHPWRGFTREPAGVTDAEPHLVAAIQELGIDPAASPPRLPDVLVINGQTYRKDI